MKRLLAKIIPNKAIGLHIGEHTVAVSLVAGTPIGVVEIASGSEDYEPGQLPSVLQRLLKPLLGGRKRLNCPVGLGLPAVRVFFSTRPMRAGKDDVEPQVLLHEALQSTNVTVDEMVVDLLKSSPGKRMVASLVSCRKKYLLGLLATLQGCGLKPPRAEPAVCALLRAGAHRYRTPRRTKVVIRLFLGKKQSLGVVAIDNSPLLWRFFELSPGQESTGIRSVVRTLQALTKPCGIDKPPETVLIHGHGAPLRQQLESPEFGAELGLPVVWCEGPGLENSAIAFGLALGGLKPAHEVLDLARSFKPPPSLRDIFPFKELAMQIMLLIGMALYLSDHSQSLHEDYLKVQTENKRLAWAGSIATEELEKEKKDLEMKVEAVRTFLASRVLWSNYTSDISGRLPRNITLSGLHGLSELDGGGKDAGGKPKRSFVLRASAPLQEGAMPSEIEAFPGILRQNPQLNRDFPLIELADLKSARPGSQETNATFTVVCLPRVVVKTAGPEKKGSPATGK